MRQLIEENATIRARLAIHHPPPSPLSPSTPPYSPSSQLATHVETPNQESHTQLSFYSNQEETPIHSRLRSLRIHNDAIRLHLFIDGPMDTPLPITWKPLNIKRYNGMLDPYEHLNAFTTHVNLYSNDDTVLCKVFPTSLKGSVLIWYKRLLI